MAQGADLGGDPSSRTWRWWRASAPADVDVLLLVLAARTSLPVVQELVEGGWARGVDLLRPSPILEAAFAGAALHGRTEVVRYLNHALSTGIEERT